MSTVLITGGAGYIGSHTVRKLLAADYQVVVYDNFSAGNKEALPEQVAVIHADLLDEAALHQTFAQYQPQSIIHFAGVIEAGESMINPERFYSNNIIGSLNLAKAARAAGNIPIVFSSSAAVYGEPEQLPIPETAPKNPTSVYGETKLAFEKVLTAYHRAYGLRHINLRYFNVCGAIETAEIGEAHPNKTHLIELALLTALGKRDHFKVFGTDYPTPDGTCIRDYIHVCDLADAHVLALNALLSGAESGSYNVGLGQGFSVQEVLDSVDRVVGFAIPRVIEARRLGDPAQLVADAQKIQHELGWKPKYTVLDDIVRSAWQWHSTHPNDFKEL